MEFGMKLQNERGFIDISADVIEGIVSVAANNCIFVKGMAHRNKADGFVQLLKRESYRKGIRVEHLENSVNIELHIVVKHGINIAAAGNSIISEIQYNVEHLTGIPVGRVDICVDSIMAD